MEDRQFPTMAQPPGGTAGNIWKPGACNVHAQGCCISMMAKHEGSSNNKKVHLHLSIYLSIYIYIYIWNLYIYIYIFEIYIYIYIYVKKQHICKIPRIIWPSYSPWKLDPWVLFFGKSFHQGARCRDIAGTWKSHTHLGEGLSQQVPQANRERLAFFFPRLTTCGRYIIMFFWWL